MTLLTASKFISMQSISLRLMVLTISIPFYSRQDCFHLSLSISAYYLPLTPSSIWHQTRLLLWRAVWGVYMEQSPLFVARGWLVSHKLKKPLYYQKILQELGLGSSAQLLIKCVVDYRFDVKWRCALVKGEAMNSLTLK